MVMKTQDGSDKGEELMVMSVTSLPNPNSGKNDTLVRVFRDMSKHPFIFGITGHFTVRVPDWMMAVMLFNIGLMLIKPRAWFAAPPHETTVASTMPGSTWALTCILIGLIRITALTVNGTYPKFRWSPHVRAVCAGLSCLVWLQITMGLLAASTATTAMAIYPYLMLFDMYNVCLAASEAGEVEKRKRSHVSGSRAGTNRGIAGMGTNSR